MDINIEFIKKTCSLMGIDYKFTKKMNIKFTKNDELLFKAKTSDSAMSWIMGYSHDKRTTPHRYSDNGH